MADGCAGAMLVCGLAMFANLNPLIKLDGYYMLSDILGIANLRPRAFRYLCSRIEGQVDAVAPGEAFVFTLYGVSAVVFSPSLVGSVLWFTGAYLLSHWTAWRYSPAW